MRSYNPFYDGDLHHSGAPRIVFSRTELFHLGAAVGILTLAFAFAADGSELRPRGDLLFPRPFTILGSFVAMASGFILHELAHKIVAQRYGHWAEFRASMSGLGLGLLVAVLAKILFAVPGAVHIQGYLTKRENGIISLVGPSMNLVVGVACLAPLAIWPIDIERPVPRILHMAAVVNLVLAILNLLPFGPLDGRKVWAWSKVTFGVFLAAGVGLLVVALQTVGLP